MGGTHRRRDADTTDNMSEMCAVPCFSVSSSVVDPVLQMGPPCSIPHRSPQHFKSSDNTLCTCCLSLLHLRPKQKPLCQYEIRSPSDTNRTRSTVITLLFLQDGTAGARYQFFVTDLNRRLGVKHGSEIWTPWMARRQTNQGQESYSACLYLTSL